MGCSSHKGGFCPWRSLERLTPKPIGGLKCFERQFKCKVCGDVWSVEEKTMKRTDGKGEETLITVRLNGVSWGCRIKVPGEDVTKRRPAWRGRV